MTIKVDDAVEAFLRERCDVTGRHDDMMRASTLVAAFQKWAEEAGWQPISDRMFWTRLASLSGRWQSPATGKRFSRVKSNGRMHYFGLLVREPD